MKTITVDELLTLSRADKLIVYSLERMIYQASLVLDKQCYWIADASGQPLRFQHTDAIRELMQDIELATAVIHLPTTFDEMIGRPQQQAYTPCEIPLGW